MAILFSDNFESYAVDTEPANYTFKNQIGTPPNFLIKEDADIGGTKKLKNNDGQWNWARYDPITITDARLQMRVGIVDPVGDIRLALRNTFFRFIASNFPGDGYQFALDKANNIVLTRMDASSVTTLACAPFPGGASKSDFIMKLECEGSAIRCFIDGNLELSAIDATYTSGKLTIGGFENGNPTNFDDLVLSDFAVGGAKLIDRRRRR